MRIRLNKVITCRGGVRLSPSQTYKATAHETPGRYMVELSPHLSVIVLAKHVAEVIHEKKFHGIGDVKIYDNGGTTFDRYTAVYPWSKNFRNGFVTMRGMSENPFHPQGFGQLCEGTDGPHLGRRVNYVDLPDMVAHCIKLDLAAFNSE